MGRFHYLIEVTYIIREVSAKKVLCEFKEEGFQMAFGKERKKLCIKTPLS